MKVLHINAVYGIGSTGRSVSELSAGLSQLGVESRVAYSSGLSAANGYVIGTPTEKKLHALGSRLFGTQAYFSARGTRGLLEYIEVESPDIVHLHNLHSNYINLPMLLGHLASHDIATVLTLDDCWFYTGKCCHYTVDECDRWQTGCGSCPRLRKDNPSWFVDATAKMWEDKRRYFDSIPRLAVIGVSDWIVSEARKSILAPAASITRIYNWIDTDVFRPDATTNIRVPGSRTDTQTLLGVASTWCAEKGLHDFIRLGHMIDNGALNDHIAHVSPDTAASVKLVLVGAIDSKTILPASMSVIPPTNDTRELAKHYANADVFLQLSREETFGKVTAEALACGTPAIVYDSTANPELIGKGCGYVVDPADFGQLVRHISRVLANTKDAYSDSCRSFARRNFDRLDLIEQHLRLYRGTIGNA